MHDDRQDTTTDTCAGCGRLNPTPAAVCEGCRDRAADQLAGLPALHEQLVLAQVPGSVAGGRGPAGKRTDAPLPVRVDALSLLAAGTLDVDSDDLVEQTGSLPLALWLNDWAGDWIERGYQPRPVRARVFGGWPSRPGDAGVMRQLLTGAGKLVVGHDIDGRPIRRAIGDTLQAEYLARFGSADRELIAKTVAYLAIHLDDACDRHDGIADFLAGLRVLYGACQAAVGERSQLHHLGRCPERRIDHETGEQVLCGAALWTDPYVTSITCPRCRKETPEREWLTLGHQIRSAWPVAEDLHQMAARLVVVPERYDHGQLVQRADQYWTVGCTCGGLTATVRGRRADVRGVWTRHRDYRRRIADVVDGAMLIFEWLRVNGADPDEVLEGTPVEVHGDQLTVRYVVRDVRRAPTRGPGGVILTEARTFTITNPWEGQ